MKLLKDILQKSLQKGGIKDGVDAEAVSRVWKKVLPREMGENAQSYIHFISFKNNKIKIKVDSSVWAQEIFTSKDKLLAIIREKSNINVRDLIILQ